MLLQSLSHLKRMLHIPDIMGCRTDVWTSWECINTTIIVNHYRFFFVLRLFVLAASSIFLSRVKRGSTATTTDRRSTIIYHAVWSRKTWLKASHMVKQYGSFWTVRSFLKKTSVMPHRSQVLQSDQSTMDLKKKLGTADFSVKYVFLRFWRNIISFNNHFWEYTTFERPKRTLTYAVMSLCFIHRVKHFTFRVSLLWSIYKIKLIYLIHQHSVEWEGLKWIGFILYVSDAAVTNVHKYFNNGLVSKK